MSEFTFETTEEASNGAEAVEKLSKTPVDVILCDVNMPEMSGVELVEKVRQMSSCDNTKIIMVSTESSPAFIEELLGKGANGYITKPFTPEQFRKGLGPLLN